MLRAGVRAGTVVALLVLLMVPAAAQAQELIYLVRHAERLDDTADPPLAPEGTARATRLAAVLADAGITAVFATQFTRTVETAAPLASALNLPIRQVDAGRHGELLRLAREAGPRARVLIVGHSDTVPELLTALGWRTTVTIAKGEYDNLFVVSPRPGAEPLVIRLRF